MEDENKTTDPNPAEQGGSEDATMSAVVASLKAQIAERDKRIQDVENKVKDRDATIKLLLNGDDAVGQRNPASDEAERLANFRKLCKF